MNKKNVNQTETGRSMVEMLGVLAIIGVLSVGGIAGYTSAMNKHRANDTVQRLMRRAVIISSQKQLGQRATLSGFDNNDGAYAISLSAGEAASSPTFTLQAANVPEDVCQKLLDLSWPSATLSPKTCASGTQDITFTFNNDLSEGEVETENWPTAVGIEDFATTCSVGEKACVPDFYSSDSVYLRVVCKGEGSIEDVSGTTAYADSLCTTEFRCSNPDGAWHSSRQMTEEEAKAWGFDEIPTKDTVPVVCFGGGWSTI